MKESRLQTLITQNRLKVHRSHTSGPQQAPSKDRTGNGGVWSLLRAKNWTGLLSHFPLLVFRKDWTGAGSVHCEGQTGVLFVAQGRPSVLSLVAALCCCVEADLVSVRGVSREH